MAKIRYLDDVPYMVEQGPHQGWTWYRFEVCGNKWKMLTIDSEDEERVRTSIFLDDDDRHTRSKSPEEQLCSQTFDIVLPLEVAVDIIRKIYSAYQGGICTGRSEAQREIRKSLGL